MAQRHPFAVTALFVAALTNMAWAEPAPESSRSSLASWNVADYGATPNDDTDDTRAIAAALKACEQAGGGTVVVPAGTFLVSRQANESPILALPSNTTLCGAGAASTLKFTSAVSNFWRMVGAEAEGCRNVTVCDLRLDGSNTHLRYEKGQTPEHNHGIFMACDQGVIENVVIRDLLVENFSGDCVAIGRGCRNITIRDVSVRNFIRQGIQLAGDDNARDYLVTGCQDLEHTVEPGGSTIHVEHARGLTGVIIQGNRCRHSILAGGVNGLILRDNIVHGRIEGNGDANAIVEGNTVFAHDGATRALMQFGYADGLLVRGNLLNSSNPDQPGIYVWGSSRYNPEPSKDVLITENVLRVQGQPISLSGVKSGLIRDNFVGGAAIQAVEARRVEDVEIRSTKASDAEGQDPLPPRR